jgi:myo-inositol-1(or 4)-monophosphatase
VQETSLEILHSHFPDVGVNAEEDTPRLSLFSEDTEGLCFHLDPLDGTLAYIRNRDDFAVGAAFSDERRFISSAVYFPALDRLYCAAKGKGISVQNGLGNPKHFERHPQPETRFVQKRGEKLLPVVEAMGLQPLDIMSAHHSMIAIAEGRVKVLLYKMASPHDFGIPQVIVEEAGGLCTDQRGLQPEYSREFGRLPWFMAFADVNAKQEFFEMLEQHRIELGDW